MSRHPRLADVAAKKFSEGMQPILTAFVFAGLDSEQVFKLLATMLADYVIREIDTTYSRLNALDRIVIETKIMIEGAEERI